MDKRSSQVLKIIICIALVLAVIFARIFIKDDNKKSSDLNNEETTGTAVMIDQKNNEIITNTVNKNDDNTEILQSNLLDTVDTSLYVENATSEAIPENEIVINLLFTNGEVLYEKDYPSGIYKNMNEEFQKFVNENIDNPGIIKEIEILEDTIHEDDEKKVLSFDTKLNDGTILSVEVDLYTFEYTFKD